ncbi:MAG: Acetyltransferase family [Planctomycetota bacterium]|jgi:ribosomal protein S18 acetylase RimI-like enzyme
MPNSSELHVHWLRVTDEGPVPAQLDRHGHVIPDELLNGTALLAAFQNRSLTAMAGVVARDRKICITIPDTSISSNQISRRIADDPWRLIIRAARDCAVRIGFQRLEVLVPDEFAAGLDALCRSLQRSGLQCKARIAVWQKTSPASPTPKPAPGYTIQSIPARSINRSAEDRRRCNELLTLILADSCDLANLPTPEPAALLNEWDESDGVLIFESDPVGRRIAVCCCIGGEDEGEHLPRSTEIRFLGVHPQLRRKGSASRLIAAATLQANLNYRTTSPQPGELTVCVDNDNTAAVQLYENAGFSRQRPFQLWIDSKLPANSGWRFTDES